MENGVTSAQIKGKSPIDSCTSIQPWPNCHFYIPECKLSRLLHFENYICIVVERASVPNYIDNVSFSQPFIFFIYISLLILRKFWEEIRWWNLHVSSRLHELWTHQKLYRETPSYHLRIYQVKKKKPPTLNVDFLSWCCSNFTLAISPLIQPVQGADGPTGSILTQDLTAIQKSINSFAEKLASIRSRG